MLPSRFLPPIAPLAMLSAGYAARSSACGAVAERTPNVARAFARRATPFAAFAAVIVVSHGVVFLQGAGCWWSGIYGRRGASVGSVVGHQAQLRRRFGGVRG
jgi:hypothetical protein